MQTKKSQPSGQWIITDTGYHNLLSALSLSQGLGFLGLHRIPMVDSIYPMELFVVWK